ncbi:general secretion pathway protein GspB [Beggiatoa leptomitoformis]|uniref:GspB domain-containing protein n=1 Tax=Beggiatoa leptomitoformis TaxID=288004 RepID=A0A2N9YC30_9GAMM|nr:general secretion pathway protein GspB [Beggiatoa leptomitoformis]ALG66667.1 GspB domain-containing protein [Beggiatoa leptomitoformis]AUI68011.1 GspB domain-containing protein [Beggiatoa leptomitoformis]
MSYILDALKKAERERGLGKIPSLDSTYPPLFTPPAEYSRWLLFAGIGVIGLISASLVWHGMKTSPVIDAQTTVNMPVVRLPTDTPSPLAQQAQVSLLTKTIPTAQPSPPVVYNPLPSVAPKPETATLPALSEIPAYLQQKLPALTINAHVYATEAQQRFVLINGRRYREGMSIQEGMTVESIRSNDVVINYQQKRFRLSVR